MPETNEFDKYGKVKKITERTIEFGGEDDAKLEGDDDLTGDDAPDERHPRRRR